MAINAACLRTLSPQRADARLGEEMFMNGYALKTREWSLMASPSICKGRMMKARSALLLFQVPFPELRHHGKGATPSVSGCAFGV